MDYFPAFLKLDGKRCLLVGGGEVAARKARLLLAAGADLIVVAPELGSTLAGIRDSHRSDERDPGQRDPGQPPIESENRDENRDSHENRNHENRDSHRLRHVPRRFVASDVEGHWLVVSATGDPACEKAVFEAANRAGVFCNAVDDRQNCSYVTPAIVDRSPVIVAVSSAGSAPVLARQIRARIEAMLPAGLGKLAALAGSWRRAVRERIGDLRARLRFWERVFDGRIESDVYRGRIDAADAAMARLLEEHEVSMAPAGEAWLVGAGPGDPDLLTLKALQVMQSADVILHDRLVSEAVLNLARRDAEKISVGKTPGCRANGQDSINELLVELVASGKRVCRLKGGDPFVFGRGGEEACALAAAGLPYQVVPGITAAAGCAAYAGIPLTHRDAAQSVVLLTAHGKNSVDTLDWPSLARDRQTLAVYMAVRRFPDLMNKLIAHGRAADTPVAVVERGTTPQQRVIRGSLGQLTMLARAHRIEAPAMLIIGEVARFGETVSTVAVADSSSDSEIDVFAGESAIQKIANN